MFLPDVFKLLHSAIDGLTGSNSTSQVPHPPEILQKQVDSLIKSAGDHRDVVKSMIMRLFPAAGHYAGGSSYESEWQKEWLKERRVAHKDILRLYLEHLENENLQAFIGAEQAWKHIADRDDFEDYLNSIDQLQLQKIIESLEVFEEQFAPEHVVPGAIVLLNLLPLPDQRRGMFDLSPTSTVIRIISHLLKSLNDPAEVKTKVDEILPKLESLSAKLALINIVGYQEGVGHRLVSKNEASRFERAWRDEVRLAAVNDLVDEDEHDLLGVLLRTKRATNEAPFDIDSSPTLTLRVLRTAQKEKWVPEKGNRTVQRSLRLAWDDLIELYGDQETLKERVDSLRGANLDGSDDLIELADKYLGGYRDDDSQ